MRNETSCSIIRDLLPNYAEGLTSPETSEVVKAHLETCHTCRSLYEDYQKPVDIPQPEEIKTAKSLSGKYGTSRCGICSGHAFMRFS